MNCHHLLSILEANMIMVAAACLCCCFQKNVGGSYTKIKSWQVILQLFQKFLPNWTIKLLFWAVRVIHIQNPKGQLFWDTLYAVKRFGPKYIPFKRLLILRFWNSWIIIFLGRVSWICCSFYFNVLTLKSDKVLWQTSYVVFTMTTLRRPSSASTQALTCSPRRSSSRKLLGRCLMVSWSQLTTWPGQAAGLL